MIWRGLQSITQWHSSGGLASAADSLWKQQTCLDSSAAVLPAEYPEITWDQEIDSICETPWVYFLFVAIVTNPNCRGTITLCGFPSQCSLTALHEMSSLPLLFTQPRSEEHIPLPQLLLCLYMVWLLYLLHSTSDDELSESWTDEISAVITLSDLVSECPFPFLFEEWGEAHCPWHWWGCGRADVNSEILGVFLGVCVCQLRMQQRKERDEAAWSHLHGFRAAAEPNLETFSLVSVSDNTLSSRTHI